MSAQDENVGPWLMRVLPQTSRGDGSVKSVTSLAGNAPTKIYRPNSRSISQPSNPAAVSGRADGRVGTGLAALPTGCGAAAVGAEGALTCDAVCIRFEKKPPACEFGRAATGTP